jgi:hypothetical protein
MAVEVDGQTRGFGDFEKRIFDFIDALAAIGVQIEKDSPLEKACYDVMRVHMLYINPQSRDPHEDVRLAFRPLLGLWTLIDKTLRLKGKKGFEAFRAHYQMLKNGVAWQNDKYAVGDQAADKIFELVFGLSVLAVGDDLEVDDPVHSAGGTNPDILATINGVGCVAKLPPDPKSISAKAFRSQMRFYYASWIVRLSHLPVADQSRIAASRNGQTDRRNDLHRSELGAGAILSPPKNPAEAHATPRR